MEDDQPGLPGGAGSPRQGTTTPTTPVTSADAVAGDAMPALSTRQAQDARPTHPTEEEAEEQEIATEGGDITGRDYAGDGGAAACLRRGDVFLATGLSWHFQIGCDTLAMTIQKKATAGDAQDATASAPASLGFRDLPPGAHFVWVSPPGAMARQGYWFVTKPAGGVVRVKQWDRYNEVLGACASQYEERALAGDIGSFYAQLMPYNSHHHHHTSRSNQAAAAPPPANPLSLVPLHGARAREAQTAAGTDDHDPGLWKRLASCITEPLLSRVLGEQAAGGRAEWLLSTMDTAKGEPSMLKATTPYMGHHEFCFLFAKDDLDPYRLLADRDRARQQQQQEQQQRTGAAGHDGTGDEGGPGAGDDHHAGALDTTQRIVAVLDAPPAPATRYTEGDLVGELQFAFLTGTLLSNLSCLEQWWHLVLKVFLRARNLVTCRPALCRSLLAALHAQFVYLDRHMAGGFANRFGTAAAQGGGGGEDDGGTGIFDVKPHGAARLYVALAAYKRHLDAVLPGIGESATPDEVGVGQAFAELEALLWQYGWDLRRARNPETKTDHTHADLRAHPHPRGYGGSGDLNDDDDYGEYGDEDDYGDEDGAGRGTDMDDGVNGSGNRADQAQKDRRRPRLPSSRPGADVSDSDDEGEDGPVLVDLDENGREIGLVSWN